MTRRQNEYFCRFNETTGAGENAQDHRPVIRAGRRVVIRHQGRGKIRLTIGRISRTLTARTTTTTSSPADFKAVDENQTIDGYSTCSKTASSCAVISSRTPAVRTTLGGQWLCNKWLEAGRRQQVLPRLQAAWLCQDRHLPYLRVWRSTPRMKTASGRSISRGCSITTARPTIACRGIIFRTCPWFEVKDRRFLLLFPNQHQHGSQGKNLLDHCHQRSSARGTVCL